MPNIFNIILIILLLTTSTNSLKIFLLGGAVTQKQPDVYINMAKATGKIPQPNNCSQDWSTTTCPKVAVVTSAAQTQEEGNYYYNVDEPDTMCFKRLFNLFGCSPKHVSVHRDNSKISTDLNTAQGQANYDLLKNADIIFFDGGDQIRHSYCWLTNEGIPIPMFQLILDRAKSNSVILGGTSAGTMIWSNPAYGGGSTFGHVYFAESMGLAVKKISDGAVNGTGLHDIRNGTSGLLYEENGAMFQGFGLLPYLLDTHFDVRGRLARMISGLVQTKQELGFGMDEPVCLYYDNGVGHVYGKGGVFIADISKATRNKNPYFTINNVHVSYLTVGDTFHFQNKTIIPSPLKHPITQPKYKTHHDSYNTFSAYQTTEMLTKLVDQTPAFNVGRSKIPSGFPKSTPTFKLTLERGVETLGFYSTTQDLYTVDRAIAYISYE